LTRAASSPFVFAQDERDVEQSEKPSISPWGEIKDVNRAPWWHLHNISRPAKPSMLIKAAIIYPLYDGVGWFSELGRFTS
jgi:hypothetical protein